MYWSLIGFVADLEIVPAEHDHSYTKRSKLGISFFRIGFRYDLERLLRFFLLILYVFQNSLDCCIKSIYLFFVHTVH